MATKRARPAPLTQREIVSDEFKAQVTSTLSAQDRMLEKLDRKLEDAHVLNGGFDTLMKKVEKIESVQEQLGKCQEATSEKVTAIHTAIYDPEKGLYAKVKGVITWINTANWVIKGVIGVAGAGALGGICKLTYDIVTGHLLVHYAH
jgi:hypothetical protein